MANEPIAFAATFNVVPPEYLETSEQRDAWAASVRELAQSWIETDLEKYGIHFEHSPTDVVVRSVDKAPLWIVVKYPWLHPAYNVLDSCHDTDEGQAAGLKPFYRGRTTAETACAAINVSNPSGYRDLYGVVAVPNPY